MSLLSATLLALSLVVAPQAQTPDQRTEAVRLARSGEHARALEQFQAIAAANPDDLEARLWIARLHGLMGRPGRAIDVYRSIVAVAPQSVDALVGLGSELITVGRLTDAADALDRAEAIAADTPAVLAAQGRLHRVAVHSTLALAYYQRALALDTANVEVREAYDVLRAERAHRLEGTYYFEHYNVDVPNTHSGLLEFNARVGDSVRLFAGGQYQRKFDRNEERAGGGFEWNASRSAWFRLGGLFGNDTIVLPEADVLADFQYAQRRISWLASARYLHFPTTSTLLWSPGVTLTPNDSLALTLRYYRSETDFSESDSTLRDDGFSARVTARAKRRVWLTGGYSRGFEALSIITSEWQNQLDAETATAGIRFDPVPMSSIGATYEHQWRDNSTRVSTVSFNFVQRF